MSIRSCFDAGKHFGWYSLHVLAGLKGSKQLKPTAGNAVKVALTALLNVFYNVSQTTINPTPSDLIKSAATTIAIDFAQENQEAIISTVKKICQVGTSVIDKLDDEDIGIC